MRRRKECKVSDKSSRSVTIALQEVWHFNKEQKDCTVGTKVVSTARQDWGYEQPL